ncbi:MAG: TIGR04551 family protein, partial [Myxococcales bacterium]
ILTPPTPATTATPAGPVPAPLPSDPATARDASKPAPRPETSQGVQGALSQRNSEIFSEEWWSHTRPVLEMHGYYRVRAELFHNFFLGRVDGNPNATLFAPPVDYAYTVPNGTTEFRPAGCATTTDADCRKNKTLSSANMRLRLNPEIHVSDNLRVLTQVDLLDNLVLGSTPNTYYVQGNGKVGPASPYAPRSFFANTTEPPTAGRNGLVNSIAVKRAWGEYSTPLGMVRFGRQPNHWGIGMLHNSGDGHDSDWQSSVDRIMFMTGIKSLDLYFAGMWDFPSEGSTRYQAYELQGQPYDAAQLDDVSQYGLMIMRRRNPDLVRQDLAEGKVVINGGIYTLLRRQTFANDASSLESLNRADNTPGATQEQLQAGLVRRNAWSVVPDAWLQIRYRKFRFELEAATVQGSIDSLATDPTTSTTSATSANQNVKLRQYMLATQSEFRAMEDKLNIQFHFGWTSGDPDLTGADALAPKTGGLYNQGGSRTLSMASFHPDYRVDLILFRNIMTRVQGAYYFKPQVNYDFTRSLNGQKIGGGAGIIWSRASEFVQTPGHQRDLGVELDFQLYYQSKDGSLNDDPDRMGGFYTSLQYGVLFPLGGLGYQANEITTAQTQNRGTLETSAAHALRWYMGVLFLDRTAVRGPGLAPARVWG